MRTSSRARGSRSLLLRLTEPGRRTQDHCHEHRDLEIANGELVVQQIRERDERSEQARSEIA